MHIVRKGRKCLGSQIGVIRDDRRGYASIELQSVSSYEKIPMDTCDIAHATFKVIVLKIFGGDVGRLLCTANDRSITVQRAGEKTVMERVIDSI